MNFKKANSMPSAGALRAIGGGVAKAVSSRSSTPQARQPKAASNGPASNTPPKPNAPVKTEKDKQRDAWRSESMFKIIDLIKSEDRAFKFAEVQLHMGGQLWNKDALLMKSLKDKLNVEVNADGETIRYKWKYSIKTKNDLLQVLKTHHNKGVVRVEEDLAANAFCKSLGAFAEDLAQDGWVRILSRQKGTGNPASIWYDPWSQTDLALWESMRVDPEHVDEELKKLELTTIAVAEQPKAKAPEPTKKKGKGSRGMRGVKLMNTHLTLDWLEFMQAPTRK
ncbi:hypothetical protein SmJEL517_g02540 [Synchytrium microbalum]|uniref:Transcription initiation factor IIE subunit beta n=1 Tax=Synchytrium microbalum TaxID=1806994 RepID=A0A507C6B2_9FUNG|nr:uncharacterized protein SmJEL517_g02540 [Synchytrium microbalum]TPX34888.1 hypothetical protein SmJEL517_g02540 [Synchytrium microbalum]